MSQGNSLAPIIRKIDAIPRTLATSERVVIYDRRRREILDRKPLFAGSNIELYLISITNVVQYEGLPVTIEDFNTSRKIGLLIAYRAHCNDGDQNRLVSTLCKDSLPGLDLNRHIERWVFSLTRDRAGEFIDNFVNQLPWLRKELRNEAEQVGLHLEVRVSLDQSPMYYFVSNAKTTQNLIERENLIVPVQDVANNREIGVAVTYQARLRDEKNRDKTIRALGNYDTVADAVDERIREWILEFIGIRASQFIDNYANEIVNLQQRLENRAREDLNLILSTRIELDRNPVQYIIFNSRDTSNIARQENLVIPIEDVARGRTIGLLITYQAGFDSVDQDKVAHAFASSKSLTNEIDKKLKTWVARFIDARTAERFIDDYAREVVNLQQNIQSRAKEEVGLKLELRIQIEKQRQLETFKIGSAQKPVQLSVYVKNCDDELQLRVHTELNVDENNIVNAVLRSLPSQEFSIVNLVKKKIKDYLLESVTINEFSYQLKTEVRDRLVAYLNKTLLEYGRKVGFLSLDTDAVVSVPQEIIEIRHPVGCEVQGYSRSSVERKGQANELVYVENTVQLLPKDLSMFRKMVPATQSPNEESPLKTWVKGKLDKIVKPLLLNRRYIDILTDFEPIALAIKERMQAEAASIGFSAEHIVSVPNLKHLDLKRDFVLEDPERLEGETAEDNGTLYLTNDANVKVKLNTTVTARIENFETIAEYLSPDIEIKDLMKEAIRSTIREYLNQVIPERYYMRFYHAGVDEQGHPIEAKSVEQELKEAIAETLKNRFGAKVISVVPKPVDTPIVKHYREMRGRVGSFQFEVLPLSGGDPVRFYAEFQVLGVEKDSWYIFQERMESMQRSQESRRMELERIKERYKREVKRSFDDDAQDLTQIQKQIRLIEEELSGIDSIRKAIESSVQQKLSLLPESATAYADSRDLAAMQKEINDWARQGVKKQYGLEIEVENLRRISRTLEEQQSAEYNRKLREAQHQGKIDRIEEALALGKAEKHRDEIHRNMLISRSKSNSEELQKLREKRAKLVRDFDPKTDQEELKHLDEQIALLESQLPSSSRDEIEKRLKSLEPENPKPKVSFLEAMGQMNLPGTPPSAQIEAENNSGSSTDEPITPENNNQE